jgi:hypothetical protein
LKHKEEDEMRGKTLRTTSKETRERFTLLPVYIRLKDA